MAKASDRATALSRLAVAYGTHQVRRWTGRAKGGGGRRAEETYEPENYLALTADERHLLPQISRCINCGICAMVAGRVGGAYLPDLPSAYLRPLPLLPRTASDLDGPASADLQAAAAACPVGVPLPAVAAMVRRLSGR
ncbi:MAG: hypothetical protein M3Z13_00805 [Candidatus Dormibacteraeota bacterium]|nr:hypothetical protein [Candidatus Dormibacteraeota bacterium]